MQALVEGVSVMSTWAAVCKRSYGCAPMAALRRQDTWGHCYRVQGTFKSSQSWTKSEKRRSTVTQGAPKLGRLLLVVTAYITCFL